MKLKPSFRMLCLAIAHSLVTACSSVNTAAPEKSAQRSHNESVTTITVKNHNHLHYSREPLYISFSDLGLNPADFTNLTLFDGSKTLAFETIDRDGDGDKDGIFSLTDIGPKQTLVWQLKKGGRITVSPQPTKLTQAEISIKEGGRWGPHPAAAGKQAYQGGTFKNVNTVTLPEFYTDHSNWIRYEGPGIESDKVAYRIYLDHRNGFDIFGKTVSEPVLHKIGQDGYESYHRMLDWGMDILKVGSSLGTGGFGFWNGANLTFAADTQSRHARIIENGHLYSSIAIDYHQWLVDGQRRDLSALISMQGGSRLAHTIITTDKALPNLAIGIVKHAGTDFLMGDSDSKSTYTYIGSWGKQSENSDDLGMAVIFKTKQFKRTVDDATSYVALMQPEAGADKPFLDYYFVAAWQGEQGNGIHSKQSFINYLEAEIQKLSQPLSITIAQGALD